jgi:RNA polymerase sigma-70 factor, ECF subfamily
MIGVMESDETVVRRLREGEPDRFDVLVRRYGKTLYGRALRFTHDPCAAQDLAQEAFLQAYRRLGQLDDPARFGPWVRAILDNACRMWLRASASRPAALPLSPEGEVRLADPETETPESLFRRRELRRAVAEVCRSLPPALRTSAYLFYVTGMPCREIAEALGVPAATVESRLFKARAAISGLVAGGGRTRRHRQLADGLISLSKEDFIMDAIRIEISTQLIPWVRDEGADRGLLTVVRELRKELEAEHGLRIPKVHIIDNGELKANAFALFIREQRVASGTVGERRELPGFGDSLRRALLDHRYGMTAVV